MTSLFIGLQRKRSYNMTEDELQKRITELESNVQRNLGDVVKLRIELDNLKKLKESRGYTSDPRLLQE